MCVCILKPNNKHIPEEKLKQCYNNNPDGVGILYKDESSDNLIHHKGQFTFREFLWHYNRKAAKNSPNMILHFRTASASGLGPEYCHPFYVHSDLAFVHNGNFFEFGSYYNGRKNDGLIDTMRFCDEVLKRLPKDFLYKPRILKALQNYCKFHLSKMIFMNSKGICYIVNMKSGVWEDGCWFSNGGMDNYSGYGFSGAYEYKKGDIRHKGGLPIVQNLPEKKRDKWVKCDSCQGFYYKKYMIKGNCNGCNYLDNLMQFVKDENKKEK